MGVCQAEGQLWACWVCALPASALRAAFPDHLCRPFLLHRGLICACAGAAAIFCLAWHLGWESLWAEKLLIEQWVPVPGTWLALSVFFVDKTRLDHRAPTCPPPPTQYIFTTYQAFLGLSLYEQGNSSE